MHLEIQGMDALMQNLMNLPLEEEEENKALNAGAKVVKEAVEKEVPVGNRKSKKNKKNKLKSNIKIKRAKDGEVKVHTGKAYHGHILEGGRSAGSKYVTKKGKRQKVTWGPIAPNPFFTRGFEFSKPGALNAIADEIKKAKNL